MVEKWEICLSLLGVAASDGPWNSYSKNIKYIQQLGIVENQYMTSSLQRKYRYEHKSQMETRYV